MTTMSSLISCGPIVRVEECLSVLQAWLMTFLSQRLLHKCATLDPQRGIYKAVEFVLVCYAFSHHTLESHNVWIVRLVFCIDSTMWKI